MASLPLLLLTISSCLHHALALNILAIISLPLQSHYMAVHPLFRELAVKGHSVTVMNNYPDKTAHKNMQFIDLQQDLNNVGYITPMDFYETFDSNYLHLYNFYRHLQFNPLSTKTDCENFFTNENAKAHFDKGIKYDVIFVEMFMGECGLAYAGALYDAPIIGITSHVMLPTAYPRLGIPFNFDADAFYFSNGGPNPSLYHKAEALILDFIYNMYMKWYSHRIIYEVFDQYLPINTLDMDKVTLKRVKMMLVYQHNSLTGARLLAPQVLEIGGVHIGQPKPVPEKIKKFLADAEHGAIYVSFGSNLKANTMTPEKLQEFLKAFKKIPQKVIWKFENATLPEGYDDYVYTDTWMPQLDILCNPKVIGFVSHGGMLSLSEAAHCGKPAVVIPFFGDQFGNAASAQSVGLGQTLYFDRLTADTLADAIEEITSTKMQENAKRISKLWHDRPMPVMDSAIYWTEYVARHQSAPPSLPTKQSAWYERMLLDVALVILILVSPIVLLVAFIIKFINLIISKIFTALFGKKKTKKD